MSLRDLPAAPLAARVPNVEARVSDETRARWRNDIRAADESEATISILEPIGADFWGDGVTARRISAALRTIGERDVSVYVNSPGGDVFEGLAIYSLLREHKAKVTVKVLGLAASAASVIAMAGDDIQISRSGFLMIHNTWVAAAGDQHALRETADMLEPFDRAIADIYAARSEGKVADIRKMLDKETWLGGSDAIEQGFADGLLASDAATKDTGKGTSARARVEEIVRASGLSRREERELFAQLKNEIGKPGAADPGKRDAAEVEDAVLNSLRLASARLSFLRA